MDNGTGNWDIRIDVGIAILVYIHVSRHVHGKNPLAGQSKL